jgi:hypothetical protein
MLLLQYRHVDTAILVALIGAAITAIGWIVTRVLDSRYSARKSQAEARQRYLQRQIEEFYGPLFSLVWQVFTCNHLQHRILSAGKLDQDQRGRVVEHFATAYFKPLHDEIRQVLKSKLYLVQGADMPQSFYDYLQSSTQEILQHELWAREHIDTSFIQGQRFPDAFFPDIERTLKSLMLEYEAGVKALGHSTGEPPPPIMTDELA